MPTVQGGTSIKWNTTELQTTKRSVYGIDQYGQMSKVINTVPIARSDRSKTLSRNNQGRSIPCKIKLRGTSPADLKTQVDNTLAILEGVGNLDIDLGQDGVYRRFIAEPSEIRISQTNTLLAADLDFVWLCADPFGRDVSATAVTLSDSTITGASETATFTLGGTTKQWPTITLTINSMSGAAVNTITVTNPATGLYIAITKLFAASDVIVIDTYNKSVKVNGTEADYLGPLVAMSWAYGAGSIKIDSDFSARNITSAMSNLNLYK